MRLTRKVINILNNYKSDNPGVRANLARILMHGKLGGTGRLIILPVDQGFEHGPARSFSMNQVAYDPEYHFNLAIDAGLSAFAAPLGMIEACANSFAGQIPLIMKINSSNSLSRDKEAPTQALTGSVAEAVRLGCSAVGFTIYPGSDSALDMMSDIQEIAAEAKAMGLAVVIWSYPRGGNISKDGETAVDIVAYAAHMAALLGAHIIKVKPPSEHLELEAAKKEYLKQNIPIKNLSERIQHVVQSCFNGKRIVVFSGGSSKDTDGLLGEIKSIYQGGANGSIIGRNSFQRPREDAIKLLNRIIDIYKGKWMKINANSLKVGNVLSHNNELWTVVKINHVKPGKGGAFIQTELKNVKDLRKLNERFRSTENLERIILEEKKATFLYKDSLNYIFMDTETYEQIEINQDIIGEQKVFLTDGMEITINKFEYDITSVILPETCEVEVIEADAVIKGQTVSSSYKPAIVNNNVKVMVPPHIEIGTKIIVRPIDGTYVEKSKN